MAGFWSKILGSKVQEKATEIHRAIVRYFGVEPIWTERNFESYAKEGYQMNVWVFACIQAVASGAASVPWVLYKRNANGELTEITNHELLNLLERPDEFTSKAEFFEAYIAYMLLAGNSYIHINKPTPSSPVLELKVLQPNRIKVIPDKENFIKGYLYEVGDQKYTLEREMISHLKTFHPLDDFYGMSPVEAAARGVDNSNAAAEWNNSLLNNGARPGGALISEHPLSDPQYEKLKTNLEKNHQGIANAGKPLLLEGGLSWQEMSLSPRDMDFIAAKKMTTTEICAAFRVPPEIVGFADTKTYSNYQEARKALYEDAILPALDKARDKLNADLVSIYGADLYLDYDKSKIEALQENRDGLYTRVKDVYLAGILTKNESREELGYGEAKDGTGDEFYTPPAPPAKPEDDKKPKPGDNGKKSRFF